MESLGLIGGTFNPIHYGHLVGAQEAMIEFCLDKILFIPNKIPPHRASADVIGGEHRFAMCVLATLSNPSFEVSRIELDGERVSYTYETIREFKEMQNDAKISFIIGVDTLVNYKWYRFNDILDMVENFIIMNRPGHELYDLEPKKREMDIQDDHKMKILKIPGVDISSSEIRRRVGKGIPIKYLTPEPVEDYIYKNRLYMTV